MAADVDMSALPTICQARRQSLEDQWRLESFVFSRQYNPDQVEQLRTMYIRVGPYTFQFQKQLGKGSYGVIYLLKDRLQNVYLALKCTDSDEEVAISQLLLESGCQVLREQQVGKPIHDPLQNKSWNYNFFMELAEGTLVEYLPLLLNTRPDLAGNDPERHRHLLEVGESIRLQMLCLYNLNDNLVYTDARLENVLFKCDNPEELNSVRFLLGDLGSAVRDSVSGLYIASYVPYEFKDTNGQFPLNTRAEKEAVLAWGLGILLLGFLAHGTVEYRRMAYDQIQLLTRVQYMFMYNQLENAFGPDVATLLQLNPGTRRSIFSPLV